MDNITVTKYPSEDEVNQAIADKEPMLLLISFDGTEMIMSHIDEAMEHHILLAKADRNAANIDKYFRLVLDENAADWTFICPPDYKHITDKRVRLAQFYKDGFDVISTALLHIGYLVGINIPRRYRRHFDQLGE